ncbi:hypothetical protein AQUCO_06400033v1 [Aquilegia coerulea]|uniref:Uncharacterized protein n=1 Tax=Aquilegia coerulea TaxID=218851 RepID=A0A2G5CCJ1_AQUCA|nr:hypothetical protein AQUCO_06400033v1 [Aquilegia coerulea]
MQIYQKYIGKTNFVVDLRHIKGATSISAPTYGVGLNLLFNFLCRIQTICIFKLLDDYNRCNVVLDHKVTIAITSLIFEMCKI